ncbi:HAD-superfamily hydrolase subfamily IIA [Carpediemonas membranifera]|uniref:HAD-superfamily hydrolase subfamily IIA n=1 Tax=Carpediemonas membranifera TaxID=201153 RepID=A0A8J6AXM6_9EUKA|nr:HAD-superfamily hydrolase subfamily IIA [Carpediemonas membranifera]|eukprot:KAG9395015.1 HAD-superfamily hydrolase subfamily IIA [Carpediemonas membranifera]
MAERAGAGADSDVTCSNGQGACCVFDVDGVFRLGHLSVPGATGALASLREAGVPHVFLTNTSASPQASSQELAHALDGTYVDPADIIVSHSPFQDLLSPFRVSERPILVVGIDNVSAGDVETLYHIPHAVSTDDVYRCLPASCVPALAGIHSPANDEGVMRDAHAQFAAVAVMADSNNLTRDMQLVLDALRFDGHCHPDDIRQFLDNGGDDRRQHIPIFFANPDMVYGAAHPAPRLTQGCFRLMLESMFKALTGQALDVVQAGKPSAISYEYAAGLLRDKGGAGSVFMVGDNPASDIRGANRVGWTSCLVRTGIGARVDTETLPEEDRPAMVFPTVVEAIAHIVKVHTGKV